jgi:putative Mg2+ transporter-C (MgtC) family protein
MDWAEPLNFIARLGMAAVLGGLIGLEREARGRSAGLRTQLLVAVGSALAMIVSLQFGAKYGDGSLGSAVQVDPARVAYGVMAGVGFLGAGAMIRYGVGIRGMTTAASLWCTAAVGLACGFEMYIVALTTTIIVLFALYVLAYVDRLVPTKQHKKIIVELPAGGDVHINLVRDLLASRNVRVLNVDYRHDVTSDTETITFYAAVPPRTEFSSILEIMKDIPGLKRFSIA